MTPALRFSARACSSPDASGACPRRSSVRRRTTLHGTRRRRQRRFARFSWLPISLKHLRTAVDGYVMASTTTSTPPPASASTVGQSSAERQHGRASARGELLLKRDVRSAWLCLAVGVLIPLFALGTVYYGVRVRRFGREGTGVLLIALGLAVFLLRVILYLG